ncbi:Protein CbbY [Nocardia seriolae]|uniref:Hydrolase n=1 Tax=Nocardia seriolae TaxID=37332 RepID=A0ABC8AY54_9NOCA|nr:Protein CbbY [Nocardia seriolae]GEM22294.1 phosphoglycolate phosphatase [Nocardia seriolae NBRC 15557]BAW06885.1 HAD family hydrolase [Nocardia seriolae]BEK88532.1 HAD family hydrolase [Nocardia seriolae]BEK96283.1 HAD family hydrolase [Nocardia seriolae]
MARLDAVLWDMDGTLLDSEKLWDMALRELAAEYGHELNDAVRHALIGASGPNAFRILFEGLGIEHTPETVAHGSEWMERRVIELFQGEVPWRPGAREALETLRAAGIPMALVTNTKRSLTEYGLDTIGREFFGATVCADEVPQGKPAPDVYRRAAELLGVVPGNAVAIEDSPTGSIAAQAAGCALLVVPCEVPVPDAPGRTFRESLVGLTVGHLEELVRVRAIS